MRGPSQPFHTHRFLNATKQPKRSLFAADGYHVSRDRCIDEMSAILVKALARRSVTRTSCTWCPGPREERLPAARLAVPRCSEAPPTTIGLLKRPFSAVGRGT
ncbi:uncharacterized protein LOC144151532 isoform X2 [Haemaphysalis longicornis]